MKTENESSNEINEQIKETVIARIEARMSSNLRLSIGSEGSLDKGQMIYHVKRGDEIGRQIVKIHLNFIRAQATGELANLLNKV